MGKILSQAGVSLADVYDVEGSIAGTEELLSKDVSLFHEMGAQIHSERLQRFVITLDSGAVAQTTAWDVEAGGIPDSINRVFGIFTIAFTAARVNFCTILLADVVTGLEIPIWSWDNADDVEKNIRHSLNGAAAANVFGLVPSQPSSVPNMIIRTGADQQMPSIFFRGQSTGFGAGTVQALAHITIARPDPGNPAPGHPSSHGLPIPSW